MFRTLAATALGATVVSAAVPNDDYDKEFKKFVHDFNRTYTDDVQRVKRFLNFKKTYDFVKSENAKGHKYELGINEFSDMSPAEFAKTHFGYTKPEKPWGNLKNLGTHVYNGAPLADSVDWVSKGAVTPPKNQGQCGSCWSFSTTGSLEGALQISTGKLVSLSEEMLVDCSTQNHGCGGGSMDLAFQYVETNGLCTEESYSYTAGGGQAGSCKASSCTKGLSAGAVTGFHDVTANSEQAMMSALQIGPVSIAVEADKAVFQSYKSGVMTGVCGTQLDHGILAVGYGTSDGTAYWKVKNSWGEAWGMQGYGNLLRGKKPSGECGLLAQASYPEVSGTPGPSPGPSPPSPSPPPTPPAPSTSHYEDPKGGCKSDEIDIQVQGVTGAFCAPSCSFLFHKCPADVPTGVEAKPQCSLQNASTKKKYCALMCTPSSTPSSNDAQCGANASCKTVQAGVGPKVGLCTYDDARNSDSRNELVYDPHYYDAEKQIVV